MGRTYHERATETSVGQRGTETSVRQREREQSEKATGRRKLEELDAEGERQSKNETSKLERHWYREGGKHPRQRVSGEIVKQPSDILPRIQCRDERRKVARIKDIYFPEKLKERCQAKIKRPGARRDKMCGRVLPQNSHSMVRDERRLTFDQQDPAPRKRKGVTGRNQNNAR